MSSWFSFVGLVILARIGFLAGFVLLARLSYWLGPVFVWLLSLVCLLQFGLTLSSNELEPLALIPGAGSVGLDWISMVPLV